MFARPKIGLIRGMLALFLLFVPLGTPQADTVILTLLNPKISGSHGQIAFSRDDLKALPQLTIRTGTDFTDGVSTFIGPRAIDVIDRIGRTGSVRVRMTAANAFSVDVDIAELVKYGAILALEMDGKTLTLRGKGPIWMMYPIDTFPELQDPAFNNRLIWQLQSIELF